jgi:hypothetical protein
VTIPSRLHEATHADRTGLTRRPGLSSAFVVARLLRAFAGLGAPALAAIRHAPARRPARARVVLSLLSALVLASLTASAAVAAPGDRTVRLITTPGAGALDASFAGASEDGSRVWFQTKEPNPGLGDADASFDVYERSADGALRLISTPGAGAFDAFFVGASQDGSRVWFGTKEPNPALGDADASLDLFELRWGVPGNVRPPVASGVGRVGEALTCDQGLWAGDGFSLGTQWLRDGAPVPGQTSASYALCAADAGRGISCRVTAANVVGSAEATSNTIGVAPLGGGGASTGRGTSIPLKAPRLTRPVRVRGASVVGTRLRCDATGIVGATRVRVSWQRGGRVVAGGATYRVRRADLGRRIFCRVLATNSAGSLARRSAARPIPARCRVPALRGRSLGRARELAGRAGCRVRLARTRESGVARGAVLRTRPPVGRSGPNGTTVTITIRR